METLEIKIEVGKTANPKAYLLGDRMLVGRGELKAALKKAAESQIDALVGKLFPARGK